MAAPIPPLLRPERIPKGPQVRYWRETDWGPPPQLPGVMTMEEAHSALARWMMKPWKCEKCGATGEGDAVNWFIDEEVEHCLTGCNGSLRAERS